jgi:hypothetical protein
MVLIPATVVQDWTAVKILLRRIAAPRNAATAAPERMVVPVRALAPRAILRAPLHASQATEMMGKSRATTIGIGGA